VYFKSFSQWVFFIFLTPIEATSTASTISFSQIFPDFPRFFHHIAVVKQRRCRGMMWQTFFRELSRTYLSHIEIFFEFIGFPWFNLLSPSWAALITQPVMRITGLEQGFTVQVFWRVSASKMSLSRCHAVPTVPFM
jgi:hypothetical protein